MLHLLEALAREFQFTIGGLLGLLDERVQDDHALANEKAIEGPADSRSPARAQLEQAIAEGARVRQAKTGAMLRKELNQTSVVGKDIYWPCLDLGENALMEV